MNDYSSGDGIMVESSKLCQLPTYLVCYGYCKYPKISNSLFHTFLGVLNFAFNAVVS